MKEIFIILLLFLSSCGDASDWRNPRTKEDSVYVIPDSLRTDEQRNLYDSLEKLTIEKMIVIDNKTITINVDKSYLPTMGISERYYKIIINELKETTKGINNAIKKYPNEGIDMNKLIEDAKREYRERTEK